MLRSSPASSRAQQFASPSTRAQVDKLDAGLRSVKGAQEIIGSITSRHSVTKLVLGHNELGDDGCVILFRFLRSAAGRRYRVAEISLNSNGIGNRGLLAVAEYLKDNEHLKELFLQNNEFTADPETIEAFVDGLNQSQIQVLSLTLNRQLSDQFIAHFLPALDAPHLTSLHLSAMSLSPLSLPHLAQYLASPKCNLRTLKCNGNLLGFRAVKSLLKTVEQTNWKLLALELHSNHLAESASILRDQMSTRTTNGEGEEGEGDPVDPNAWKMLELDLFGILKRNSTLKRETESQSLQLLKYARLLLLRSSRIEDATPSRTKADTPMPNQSKTSNSNSLDRPSSSTSMPIPIRAPSGLSSSSSLSTPPSSFSSLSHYSFTTFTTTSNSSRTTITTSTPSTPTPPAPTPPIKPFPFQSLPLEVQLYLLSFLAPSLSPAQRIRIYHYASDASTLPPLLPRLLSSGSGPFFGSSSSSSFTGAPSTRRGIPITATHHHRLATHEFADAHHDPAASMDFGTSSSAPEGSSSPTWRAGASGRGPPVLNAHPHTRNHHYGHNYGHIHPFNHNYGHPGSYGAYAGPSYHPPFGGVAAAAAGGCPSGQCGGGGAGCGKERERMAFWKAVGCESYDPRGREGGAGAGAGAGTSAGGEG